MKYAFVLSALAAAAAAQDSVDSLPQCGQTCANNMMADSKAQELDCDAGDMQCLCENPNFMYGLRDCATAVCDGDGARQVMQYAMSVCAAEGVAITTQSGGSGGNGGGNGGGSGGSNNGGTVDASDIRTIYTVVTSDGEAITSAIATTTVGGGAGGSGGDDTDTGLGAMVTTLTSDGSVIVQTLTDMLTSAEGAASSAAGAASSAAGAASSAVTSLEEEASDIASSIASAATSAGNGGGNGGGSGSETTGGSGGSGGQTTTDSDDAAVAQMTAAPLAIAAAGLAALLL